jgi:hypothetical protein
MLFEGVLLLSRGRPTVEMLVAAAAVAMFLYSVASVTGVIVRGELWYRPLVFHWVVILLTAWCAWRLARLL